MSRMEHRKCLEVHGDELDCAVCVPRQIGGTHYEDMPFQPFAIIDAFGLDFYGGNALKYLLRAGRKPGTDTVEELRKARHYLDEMIKRAEGS